MPVTLICASNCVTCLPVCRITLMCEPAFRPLARAYSLLSSPDEQHQAGDECEAEDNTKIVDHPKLVCLEQLLTQVDAAQPVGGGCKHLIENIHFQIKMCVHACMCARTCNAMCIGARVHVHLQAGVRHAHSSSCWTQ